MSAAVFCEAKMDGMLYDPGASMCDSRENIPTCGKSREVLVVPLESGYWNELWFGDCVSPFNLVIFRLVMLLVNVLDSTSPLLMVLLYNFSFNILSN